MFFWLDNDFRWISFYILHRMIFYLIKYMFFNLHSSFSQKTSIPHSFSCLAKFIGWIHLRLLFSSEAEQLGLLFIWCWTFIMVNLSVWLEFCIVWSNVSRFTFYASVVMDYSCGLGPHLSGSLKRSNNPRRSISSSKYIGGIDWRKFVKFLLHCTH